MTIPAIKSFLRKTISRSPKPSQSSTSSRQPQGPPSRKPSTAREKGGIEKSSDGRAEGGDGRSDARDGTISSTSSESIPADGTPGAERMAKRKGGGGDASSAQSEGILKEASSAEGESKSKDRESAAAREDQEEHKGGDGEFKKSPPRNLPAPEKSDKAEEVERTTEEQNETRDVKDAKSSPAKVEMPVKVPEREEDASSVKNEAATPPSSSSPTLVLADEASSGGESKGKDHDIVEARDGQEEHKRGEGKLKKTPPGDLPTPEKLDKVEAARRDVRDDAKTAPAEGEMRAGVMPVEVPEREEDASSVKNEAVTPPSSPTLVLADGGESKGKDQEIVDAREGQEEHKRDKGKLESLLPSFPAPGTLEQSLQKDDTAPSSSSKPMPAGGDIRAGEELGKMPGENEGEGEGEGDASKRKNKVAALPSSSSPTARLANETSSEGESKSKHREVIVGREGEEERKRGEGKLNNAPPNLMITERLRKGDSERMSEEQSEKDDAMPSTSTKPVPADGNIAPFSSLLTFPPDEGSSGGENKRKEHENTVETEARDELTKDKGVMEKTPVEEADSMKDSTSSTSLKPMLADEGTAGEMFAERPERKNKGIVPSSPPLSESTSEASSAGGRKGKEHDSTVAREEQDEQYIRGIERTSEEQKGDAFSTSSKPMHDDKKIQAGDTAGFASPPSMPSVAIEEKTARVDDVMPVRKEEEEADRNGGKTVDTSTSLKTSTEESKNREYGRFGDQGGDGGGDGGSSNVQESAMSSTSLKQFPDEIPAGDQKKSSMEAISSSSSLPPSIPAVEYEEKQTKSSGMIPKREEGDDEEHITDEPKLKIVPSPSPVPETSLTREEDGQEAESSEGGGIVHSPSPFPLQASKQSSSTGDNKMEESGTKLEGESTSEESKLSSTIADKKNTEEETKKGASVTEFKAFPPGSSSTDEPKKTTVIREGQEKLEMIPKQPHASSSMPKTNKELTGEEIITRKEATEEESLQGTMSDVRAIMKKKGGAREEIKGGARKMVRINSKPSYEEGRASDDGAIPSAPVPALPGRAGTIPFAPAPALPGRAGGGDQLRDSDGNDNDEIVAEKNAGGEGGSEWRLPEMKLGVIAMVAAVVCMGSVVLLKRLEDIRRRK